MNRWQVGLALAVLIIVAAPASAQQRRTPRDRVEANEGTQLPAELRFADIKLGPFYLQPRVGLRELGWDSNILGTPSAVKVQDFRLTAVGGTRLVLPIRREHLISGDAEIDYLWFADTKELRTFNGAFEGRYEYDSDRWNIDLRTRYINAQRGQLDVIEIGSGVVAPDYEIFGRIRQRTLDVAGTFRWNLGTRIFIEPRAMRRIIRYLDDPDADVFLSAALDRTEESLGGTIGYRLTPKTALALDADYQFNDYESAGNFREADSYRLAGSVELDESSPIYGTVLLGYRKLRPTEAGLVGFEGLALDGELSATPGGSMKVTVAGDRDVYPTFWFGNVFYQRQGAGLTVLFQAQRSFALGGEVAIHENRYPVEATADQLDGSSLTAKRYDRIYRAVGRLEWSLSGSTRATFRMGWVQRDSNFDVAATDGLVVGGSFSRTF